MPGSTWSDNTVQPRAFLRPTAVHMYSETVLPSSPPSPNTPLPLSIFIPAVTVGIALVTGTLIAAVTVVTCLIMAKRRRNQQRWFVVTNRTQTQIYTPLISGDRGTTDVEVAREDLDSTILDDDNPLYSPLEEGEFVGDHGNSEEWEEAQATRYKLMWRGGGGHDGQDKNIATQDSRPS